MLLITAGEANNIIVTLTEKTTLPAAVYLFVFLHVTTKCTVRMLKEPADDLSQYPKRFNEYEVDGNDFPHVGQYLYNVYEMTAEQSARYRQYGLEETDKGIVVSDGAGGYQWLYEVENGRMEVVNPCKFTYKKYEPKAAYTAYAG